jgi:hypothetical protein
MKSNRLLAGAGALAIFGAAAAAFAQAGGGTATYWMTADTASGMSAMAAGGSAGSMMNALRGRGDNHVRTLTLQLGSSGRASGAPTAEHLPPVGLQAGASLPLVTPVAAPRTPASTTLPPNMQRPQGRMLIYWGCGERAGPGQPVVVDFASMSAGKMPPAFANSNFKPVTPPSAASHATYGEWPNQRSQTKVPARGSLVGEHVVRGNYSPEIRFALAASQDFLAPVALTSQSAVPSGAVPLTWRPVPGARAWFASTMGAGQNGDMIMWSSTEIQSMAWALAYGHVSEAEIQRLVAQRILLLSTADRCTVPSEVARAAPQSMLSLIALGGESNISQPRPAGAARSWKPVWTVKLLTKSTYAGLLGMDMAEMMSGRDRDDGSQTEDDEPRKKKKLNPFKKGLERVIGN